MQTTELDPTLSQALAAAREPGLTLIIGNKNYSSWSMRPWVAMTAFGIPFQEVRVLLDCDDTAAKIAAYSACGRVPVLLAGEMTIWDSLAICEYLAEQFQELHLWPQDVAARAMARSICAEMHAGFAGQHQFLFGEFSIADAYYAPVVVRFRTYGVTLAPALNAYCERVLAHPAVARWVEEAMAETETAPKHDADMPE